jgi:hypothetical protein
VSLEVALLVLALAAVHLVARGLQPAVPALAGVLRGLLHPLVLALVAACVLLIRHRRTGRATESGSSGADES